MKIIEAIKEFPLILKKMDANNAKIQEYSSILSVDDDLPFGTPEAQRKEVESLVQSNTDLYKRYLKLSRDLAYTNTQVYVEINGLERSITEWLTLRGLPNKTPQVATRIRGTYQSLNVVSAQNKLQSGRAKVDLANVPLSVIRLYDQKFADSALRNTVDTLEMIDAKLEVVNATTDLIEAK